MRGFLFLVVSIFILPAFGLAQDFYGASWADSSGKDGKGGAKIVSVGDKHSFIVVADECKLKVDADTLKNSPQWVVYDGSSGNSLSFEFTWVTTPTDKFYSKLWAGAGLAFNSSWATLDVSKAKYLVFYARTDHPDAALDMSLGLNGNGDSRSGEVKLTEYAEGKKIGGTWTKVIIPMSSIPDLSKVDLTQCRTIFFNLAGTYPENQPIYIHLTNIYFTSAQIVTPVENLGWLQTEDGVVLVWKKSGEDKNGKFVLSVDGKRGGEIDGTKRSTFLPLSQFEGSGTHRVSLASASGDQVSAFQAVTVNLSQQALKPAIVNLAAKATRPISPYLWGFNYLGGESLKNVGGTVNRWGGNATTGYNWKDDADNHGSDWVFLNSGGPMGIAEKDKRYYKFVQDSLSGGAYSIITIPITGWVAKVPPKDGPKFGSFPLSLFPTEALGSEPGLGSGQTPEGKLLWGNDPGYNYLPSDPAFQAEWVKTLIQDFGSSAKGGVRFYQMDNEPGLWRWTHRDIRPKGVGYDELADLNATYARTVKQLDPNAKVIGFTAWGVMELAGSNWDYMPGGEKGYQLPDSAMTDALKWTDRKAHGNVPQVVFFLQEMAKRSKKAGMRLIDYLDFHGFPEVWGKDQNGKNVKLITDDIPYDPMVCQKQFDALRIFYDPTFENPDSWCFANGNRPYLWDPFVGIFPKMRKMVAENYPGTKLSMTEYYPSSKSYYHGGLLEVATLGIFMREGLDLACDWDGTHPGNYVFFAHQLFSNYDGKGSKVGGMYVNSVTSSKDLYSFAAKDGAKTFVVLVNKNHDQGFDTTVNLAQAAASYSTYVISEGLGPRLLNLGPRTATGRAVRVRVPAFSAILVVAQ